MCVWGVWVDGCVGGGGACPPGNHQCADAYEKCTEEALPRATPSTHNPELVPPPPRMHTFLSCISALMIPKKFPLDSVARVSLLDMYSS